MESISICKLGRIPQCWEKKKVSDKKNISLASAKYFIDKYVNGLKQQIPVQGADIAGLGQLYLKGSIIGYKDDRQSNETDPAFFGLKPVSVDELIKKPTVRHTPQPVKIELEEKTSSVADQVMTDLVNDRIPPPPAKPAATEQLPVVEMPTVIERTEEPAEEEETEKEEVGPKKVIKRKPKKRFQPPPLSEFPDIF